MKKDINRWNDASTVKIVHKATEEERKAGIEQMIETLTKNVKNDDKGEDKK